MLERVKASYPRVLVEFSSSTTQESEAAAYIENPQFVISPNGREAKASVKYSRSIINPDEAIDQYFFLPSGSTS